MPAAHSYLPIALVCLLSTLSCVDAGEHPPIGSSKQAIKDGQDAESESAVVAILVGSSLSEGLNLCSGTLITKDLVLTARHCVVASPNEIDCSASTHFGSTLATSLMHVTADWQGPEKLVAASGSWTESTWLGVSQVWVPSSSSFCGNDVALIQLTDAIPASQATPLIPKLDGKAAVGDAYRAVGFGVLNQQGDSPGRRRSLDGLQVSCAGNCSATLYSVSGEWGGEDGVCVGDSGGPALDSQDRIIGVASRSAFNCGTPAYTDLSVHGGWIAQTTIQAAALGGYEPPSWAEGFDAGAGGSAGAAGAGGATGGSAGHSGASGQGTTGGSDAGTDTDAGRTPARRSTEDEGSCSTAFGGAPRHSMGWILLLGWMATAYWSRRHGVR